MTPHTGTLDAVAHLLLQFLDWVAARPRTYQETMEAWRTSCPRISVWEDALIDGLVAAEAGPAGSQGAVRIVLTPTGLAHLRLARAAASTTLPVSCLEAEPPVKSDR